MLIGIDAFEACLGDVKGGRLVDTSSQGFSRLVSKGWLFIWPSWPRFIGGDSLGPASSKEPPSLRSTGMGRCTICRMSWDFVNQRASYVFFGFGRFFIYLLMRLPEGAVFKSGD